MKAVIKTLTLPNFPGPTRPTGKNTKISIEELEDLSMTGEYAIQFLLQSLFV